MTLFLLVILTNNEQLFWRLKYTLNPHDVQDNVSRQLK